MYTWRRMKNWKWTICFSFRFRLPAFTVMISNTPRISFSFSGVIEILTRRRMKNSKNEPFVSDLGLSSWHSHWRLPTHLGFLFHSYVYSGDCSHGNKQSWKINFLLFSTYLVSCLELFSVKCLETRQFFENDFGQ